MTAESSERASVEVEGQSIDDAIDRALQQLGVTRDKVDIEILSHRPRGLFGLGRRRASVRATLRRPVAASAPESIPSRPALASRSTDVSSRVPSAGADFAPPTDAVLSRASGVLAEIVRLTGSAASIEVVRDPDGARLVIAGDADSLLIGRRGQTLDALEYLVNRIMARADASCPPLTLDVQGYRQRRQEALEAMAHSAASRARASGRPVTLDPMSPRDRRIVHMALRHVATLTTRSTGTGFYRRVLVCPVGARRGGRSRPSEPS